MRSGNAEAVSARHLRTRMHPRHLAFSWMASPAIDKRGNIGIGYSFGDAANFAGQRFAARRAERSARAARRCAKRCWSKAKRRRPRPCAGRTTRRPRSIPSDDCTIWYVGDYMKKDASELLDAHRRVSTSWMHTMRQNTVYRLRLTHDFVWHWFLSHLRLHAPGTPEQQFVDDAMRALGGRSRVEAAKTIDHRRRGRELQPRAGHEARGRHAAVRDQRLQAPDRHRQRPAARRTDPHAEVRVLPGAAAADADPGTRWRRGVQRQSAGAGGPRGGAHAKPIAVTTSITIRSRCCAPTTGSARPRVTNVRTVGAVRQADITTAAGPAVDDDDRRGGPAVVDLVEGVSPEPRRRGDDDDVRRVPGRQRPASCRRSSPARSTTSRPGRFSATQADARWRGRRSRGAGRGRRKPAAPPPPNVTVEPIGKGVWFLAGAVASQRARRVRRSPDADRSAAERSAHAGGDREGEGDRAEQAADAAGDHASSLRSHRRHARGDRRRA